MTDIDLKLENIVDELMERGISVDHVATAVEEVGIKVGPKLLAKIASRLREKRLEDGIERDPGDTAQLKGKIDSIYQNELFKRQARDLEENATNDLNQTSSWQQYESAFGGDLSFLLKIAQRTLAPPFPRSFIQYVADLRGATYRTVSDYLIAPPQQLAAEHSARRKPDIPTKESFYEALERSSVPEPLKQRWLNDDESENNLRSN